MSRLQMKKWISLISYLIIYFLLLIPVLSINSKKESILSLGMCAVVETNKYEVVVILQAGLIVTFCVFSFLYLLSCLSGRCMKINLMNVFIMILFNGLHFDKGSMLTFCQNKLIGKLIIYIVLIITIAEFVVRIMPDKETIKCSAKDMKDNAVVNQSRLFYHIIWKNFKQNWKDYLLILICNIILFTVNVVAFHMMQLLDGNYGIRKIQIFNGLSEILINAMIPMAILSVFLIIMLVFYYLKTRAKNYGILLTLGMYRKTLYYVTALEFGFIFLVSILAGSVIGRLITGILVNGIRQRFEIEVAFHGLGAKPYLYSIATILFIFIVAFMSAKDIFYDFNVGKSEDMRGIAEKMPGKIRYFLGGLGIILCIYSIIQYRKLNQFENEYLVLVFFVGLFLIVRNGLVIYLIQERKDVSYIIKILQHNQLFHKSMTSSGFITVFTIIQFCVLFYFTFQLNSVLIAEDLEEMFPYDFICLVDDSDDEYFEELTNDYDVEIYEYPMVRVTAYDSTEKAENPSGGTKPTQGQHIGISESTYHALKKQLDLDYVEKNLKLDDGGKNIYIVYQQDKSVKAQPISFYTPLNKALLHIGSPCRSFDIFDLNREELGYQQYIVTGREIGSLIGTFRQGVRENIVVFSDEYFDTAKEMWKIVDIRNGRIIEDEEMRISGLTIAQGVTKLVLIKANTADISAISNKLNTIQDKHTNIENELYKTMTAYGNWTSGIYDSTVSYVYAKHETIGSIEIERIMKLVMSIAAIILFICMNYMVLIVKMLSEQELNVRKQEFLKCMGMTYTERLNLIKKEYFKYFCIIPMILAVLSSIIYTKLVFDARMYSYADIKNYLLNYVPMAVIYITAYCFITYFIINFYANKLEEKI